MKHNLPIKKVVVFSKWSRKSYAIFASLGKVVKIGQVSVDISDKALNKSSQPASSDKTCCFKKHLSDIIEELRQAEGIPDAFVKQLILFLISQPLMSSAQQETKGSIISSQTQSPCFIR